ncbi:MAG: IS66 family transposase [Polyangiaceae bacterium]
MKRGIEAPETTAREAALAAEVQRLGAENAELKSLLAEQQKALDAAEADVARYRALFEQQRPNWPERVASKEQQLVLEGLLEAFAMPLAPAANDQAEKPPEKEPPAGAPDARDQKPARSGHGRRPLDLTALPVEMVVCDPPEVVAAGGVGYTLIGSDASDRIAYSPARLTRLRLVRRSFRRDVVATVVTAGDGAPTTDVVNDTPPPDAVIVTGPLPDAVWPRVMADPSAIAHAIVSKYDDLLPLNRQEKITAREGFTVPRSTLCEWFRPAEAWLTGIVDAMFVESKKTAPNLAVDATGAAVRGAGKSKCAPWHVFVFVAAHQHVVFRYARTHDSIVLTKMLEGYRGYLLADASSIYDPLVRAGMVVLACCWAHVRRYFYKALETDRTRSLEAIAIIGQLFAVERACASTPMPDKTARRAKLAAPILHLFDQWLERNRPTVEPRTPLAAAFTYADNQHDELRRFLEDGRLRIDNNVCEGQLRNLVLGLNNWQYFESETGLRWYTVFRSLIASCKLHGVCPLRYLECVLRLAPHWPKRRLLELSPKYWRATAARLTPAQLAIVDPRWSSAFDGFAPTADAAQPLVESAASAA